MSGEAHAGPGLGDLENELTCSICTDLLYQPLTLLDCLHTFCGSCLKEWFFVQGTRRRSSRSTPKFTCPSCRATVRETRPNATVTTLLDIVLASNPSQAKSVEEKEEIAQKYKPGDSVFPGDDTEEDEEDGRVLDEVRQLSLQEGRSRTREQRHRAPHSSRARRAERSDHDSRRDDGRSRRRQDDDRSTRRQAHERAARQTAEAAEQSRRIEHQSSLRSLLSLSDAETMEEEILRQILEEGLLDDIDLDNLGPGQEEELSERIADAYRRRHRLRSRSRQRQEREASHSSGRPRARSHSVQRPTTGPPPHDSSRGPPVSRPYLLDPLVTRPGPSTHQRGASEQGSGRRRTSPSPAHPASSSEANLRPASRSSSDMTPERPRAAQAATRAPEPSTRRRRATESGRGSPHVWTQGTRERGSSVTRLTNSPTVASPLSNAPQTPSQSALSVVPHVNGPVSHSRPRASSRSNAAPPSYVEPSIICNGCGKPDIQYELHKTCTQCNDGDYHLCLRCYRTGRGCQNWAGFGLSAHTNFERILAMSNNEPIPEIGTPHIFISSKYQRPSARPRRATTPDDRQIASDDPAHRLQTGLFCDICSSEANETFWKCDECNEGDWGFCNTCVNQGKCCTHALLPICHISDTDTPGTASEPNETFKILSFATNCDICTHPIPASTTRFHCLVCNDGDYDICANCYLKIGATGKISKDNCHNGWRRCVKGHRMVVVGFEEHEEGQRRVVARNLVGGWALKDEHVNYQSSSVSSVHASSSAVAAASAAATSNATPIPEVGTGDWSWEEGPERRKKASRTRTPWNNPNNPSTEPAPAPPSPVQSNNRRFPPDGGVGVIAHALWSWYPEDGVEDELMFPRGAEITEGENINDDWFWGCYAGITGLFPGSHVRVLGEVV
ncbi:SH3 domain protein [Aspergillus glaucus CBS 516.65]|uniref:RING-type domain-containing protein n=1 Tax=Aspergillus glaucus CBS 516.65 TaxID=1160497 RepID=A0A1L9VN69_ASPGL|nr:hypothetical protein ASPGLDRAFT_66055 [Aspergillus glaucus CBS 516.65]OJJ85320.1 hypothetical protein ASPGLDRAFT_66055 [Aspergillus glaucus CBS 516.65]